MFEMLREASSDGVSVEDFIVELQKLKVKTTVNSDEAGKDETTAWNPKKRAKERTVYRYIDQLKMLGCKIEYDKISGRYVLKSREWLFPEKSPWSLPKNATQKIGEKLLPIIKDIMLPRDVIERIDEGIHICIDPISPSESMMEVQKTVVTAWAQRKILQIQYNRGKGGRYHVIEPHSLLFRNSEWQVVAKEGSLVKTFFLSRITEAYIVEKSFDFNEEVLKKALAQNKKEQVDRNMCEINNNQHEYVLEINAGEPDHAASSPLPATSSSPHVTSDATQSKRENSKMTTTVSDHVKKRTSKKNNGYFSTPTKNTDSEITDSQFSAVIKNQGQKLTISSSDSQMTPQSEK